MTKEKILTKNWNNVLAFGLGIPTVIYGILKIRSGDIGFGSFLVLALIGVAY